MCPFADVPASGNADRSAEVVEIVVADLSCRDAAAAEVRLAEGDPQVVPPVAVAVGRYVLREGHVRDGCGRLVVLFSRSGAA